MNEPRFKIRSIQIFLLLLAAAFVVAPMMPAEWFILRNDAGEAIIFDRGHGHWMPLNWAWGTLGWARIDWPVRALLPVLIAALCFARTKDDPAETRSSPPTRGMLWVATGIAVAFGALFALLRVNPVVNVSFGDASSLSIEIRHAGYVFPSEVLTMHLFNRIQDLCLTLMNGQDPPILTPMIAVCGSGAIFVWGSAVAAMLIGRDRIERLFLFGGPVLAGYLAQFFCYIETTFLVVAAMAMFMAGAAWMLRGEGSRSRCKRLMLVYVSVSIAMLAHGAGVVLLPATVVLALLVDTERRGIRRLRSLLNPCIPVGFTAIVLAPYYLLFIRPFIIDMGYLGNMHGGADQFNLVPWNDEAAHAVSNYVYYSMISWGHVLDIGSAFLVAAPVAVVMAIAASPAVKRMDRAEREMLVVFAVAAASAMSVPLVWQLDFGGWGDWNIATSYLYPLNFAGWVTVIFARRRMEIGVRPVLVPALIVQAAMALGILLQLY